MQVLAILANPKSMDLLLMDRQIYILRNRRMDEPGDLWMDRLKYHLTNVYNYKYWIVKKLICILW